MKKILALLAIATAAIAAGASGATASSAPIVITFEKSWVGPGHYQGTTGDGCTLDVYMSNSSVTGNVQHFTATFVVTDCGDHGFTAVLQGTFNFSTGKTALNGTVTEGWLAGAEAHEQGQLLPNSSTFVGTLELVPASA